MTRSNLTYAERRIATAFTFDLGAGYPIGLAPEWAWAHYAQDPRAHAKGQPEDAARRALNLRDQQMNIFATFSGSIALQRSLSAARAYLGQSHRRVVTVTTDPSIDIIPAIAREFSDAGVFRARCGLLRTFSNEECERLCEMIYAKASDGQGVIAVITSPENPTGAVWSADHLRRISDTCTDTKSVLVVDHCFLMAGIHEPVSVTPIWDIVDGRAPVIAVWDTGKTVHLNGSKLGFIVSGNDELSSQVVKSLPTATPFSRPISTPLRSSDRPRRVVERRSASSPWFECLRACVTLGQSLPNPRGGSRAWSSERSSSQIVCSASAVALSCTLAGSAASQVAY